MTTMTTIMMMATAACMREPERIYNAIYIYHVCTRCGERTINVAAYLIVIWFWWKLSIIERNERGYSSWSMPSLDHRITSICFCASLYGGHLKWKMPRPITLMTIWVFVYTVQHVLNCINVRLCIVRTAIVHRLYYLVGSNIVCHNNDVFSPCLICYIVYMQI